MQATSFREFEAFLLLCNKICKNPCDEHAMKELHKTIQRSPASLVRGAQKLLIPCFYSCIQNISTIGSRQKEQLVGALKLIFEKYTIEEINMFFNFYTFLLLELYDYGTHAVSDITEEYKLALLECMIALLNSVSFASVDQLYVKEHIPKFSQITYVCSELAKNEGARNIRSTAITCIMTLARVTKKEDFDDKVLCSKVADIFMFFLPGLSSMFAEIAVADAKIGHALLMHTIQAFGRIINLVMQNYNPTDCEIDLDLNMCASSAYVPLRKMLKSKDDIDQYVGKTSRTRKWFQASDGKLNEALKKMGKLTYHEHPKVRNELLKMASSVVQLCRVTIPKSVCTLIEYLIILSQDSDPEVASKAKVVIVELSQELANCNFNLIDNLKEGLYVAISSLPRKFNSVDEGKKTAAINLLMGYIQLLGTHNLGDVLLAPNMLRNLLHGLLHVAEIEKSHIRLFEEYTLKDLAPEGGAQPSFVNFTHFQAKTVENSLVLLCKELTKNGCFELVYDSLLETYMYDVARKKEALYLLNLHLSGLEEADYSAHMPIIKNILKIYTDEPLNDLSEALDSSEQSVEQIQENVLIIHLITDGIERISHLLKHDFQKLLLKTLYLVLEKAGSGHPLIRTSGLMTIQTLTISCGYKDITDLVNENFDFLSYHVQMRLNKAQDKNGALNVLSVVLKHCGSDAFLPMKGIVDEVLLESCDRYKEKHSTAYLRVFKMFIDSIRRWFTVEIQHPVVKSRKEKELDQEPFKVTGIERCDDFSDEAFEGKTAEEMYREDEERRRSEQQQPSEDEEPAPEEQKRPSAPLHVTLTAQILKRSLHFLSSKDRARKLLVLKILETGMELLRDWDDELLPVVYQTSLPLLQRFKEEKDPLVLQFSMRLLNAMARLSKDFIRRTVLTEVLPKLKIILGMASHCSYLKDKGAAYRYSQDYKLQREILRSIGPILYNVDADGADISGTMHCIRVYLSDKQPQELQAATVDFIKMMAKFDGETIKNDMDALLINTATEYQANVDRLRRFLED
ncbi:TELO2-interacting protein 1 homolog [Dendroctonus ponderosae]|uniref:TELO2-interacting protein 1 homolog n=1 Tax=Dendroctonus ponderosae TaxID=77166 RepID=UPI002035C873|nr:TELO2-interacting protein 1 homolog [Dendroctonus ponderosae]KAH1028166.1 hypothetical protein HUJ05_001548 [Dendroctonus ponderosae]